MSNDTDRTASDIQRDVERTRSELDQTLIAIEHRFSRGQLIEQGMNYLRQSGAREYMLNLSRSVRQDPLPLALVGVSLAWLMVSNGRGPVREPGVDSTSGDGFASSLKDKATSVKEGVTGVAHSLTDTAEAAKERAQQLGDSARQQAERMRQGYEQLVRDQPLALGAVGLAIGALVAALSPRTRAEDELLGASSDKLKEEVRDLGREQVEKVKQVVSATSASAGDGNERAADGTPTPAGDAEVGAAQASRERYVPAEL